MSTKIFVNLPVADLPRSLAFFKALGYSHNPQFTDDTAACIKTAGHRPAEDLFECYVTGPHSDPDPATWQTELSRPSLE